MAAEAVSEPTVEEEVYEDEGGIPAWIRIAIIVLVLAILSVAAFYITRTYLMPRYLEYKISKEIAAQEAHANQVKPIGVTIPLEGFTVNTLGSGGRRFIVADFVLEAPNEDVTQEIQSREPQVRNDIISYLRRQTSNQVLDLSFQENSQRALMEIINSHLNSGQIDSLYYTRLILQ